MSRPDSRSAVALEALVRVHHARVYRAARRVLETDADALDVCQEVFLRVLDGRLVLPGDDTQAGHVLATWAVRLSLNEKRGVRRRREREERVMSAGSIGERGVRLDGALDAERADERRLLWRHVAELPRELRVALVLRFAESRTFREIAELLGVAEASAHQRVSRGLEQLRERLAGAGLAAIFPTLEARLGDIEPGPTPAGVADRVLTSLREASSAVPGVASSVPLGGLVLGLVVAAGAVFGAVQLLKSSSIESPAVVAGAGDGLLGVSAEQPGAPANARHDVAASLAELVAESATIGDVYGAAPVEQRLTGIAVGRVVEPDGVPLAGVELLVCSIERSGKFPAYSSEALTDGSGSFRAEVPLAAADGGLYELRLETPGLLAELPQPLRVRADRETDFGALVVERAGGQTRGLFTLDLLVLDPDGLPLPGARVELSSVVDLPVPEGSRWPTWHMRERAAGAGYLELRELQGSTDSQGFAQLEGTLLGHKLLRVRPAGQRLAPSEVRIDLLESCAVQHTLRLVPATRVSGTLTNAEGVLPSEARIWALGTPADDWQFGVLAADGSFAIEGLAPEDYLLRAEAPGYSQLEVDVRGGSSGLELVLKRFDDVERAKTQRGEIHGHVVDAITGEPIPVRALEVEVGWADFDAGLDWESDLLPNELFPRPVQRAAFGEPPPPAPDFHLTGLPAGRYLVRATVKGYGNVVAGPFEVERGGNIRDVQLELEPEIVLAGTIRDPLGSRVENAHVLLTGVGPHSDEIVAGTDKALREADGRGWIGGRGRSVPDGSFEWSSLPRGVRLRAVALHPDWEPVSSEPFVLGAETSGPLELRFTQRVPR